MLARHLARQRNALLVPARGLHASRTCLDAQPPARKGPAHDLRTSPRSASTPAHPGYTSADTPVSSAHPSTMPGPSSTAQIAGYTSQASTRPHPPHKGIHEMAEGAKIGGEDAVLPEERNVKNWGPNQRMPEFNPTEGKRNPVLHGGSNQGGHDSKGNSKT